MHKANSPANARPHARRAQRGNAFLGGIIFLAICAAILGALYVFVAPRAAALHVPFSVSSLLFAAVTAPLFSRRMKTELGHSNLSEPLVPPQEVRDLALAKVNERRGYERECEHWSTKLDGFRATLSKFAHVPRTSSNSFDRRNRDAASAEDARTDVESAEKFLSSFRSAVLRSDGEFQTVVDSWTFSLRKVAEAEGTLRGVLISVSLACPVVAAGLALDYKFTGLVLAGIGVIVGAKLGAATSLRHWEPTIETAGKRLMYEVRRC